jgi:hypothetical protein
LHDPELGQTRSSRLAIQSAFDWIHVDSHAKFEGEQHQKKPDLNNDNPNRHADCTNCRILLPI